ncbi:hypothetical protein ColTof3_13313 [Colletotrichum tofieldiae]|nr:hypothetical protein ColTof3_13313 [Colletotrichum tofieldiae]
MRSASNGTETGKQDASARMLRVSAESAYPTIPEPALSSSINIPTDVAQLVDGQTCQRQSIYREHTVSSRSFIALRGAANAATAAKPVWMQEAGVKCTSPVHVSPEALPESRYRQPEYRYPK